MMEVLLYMASLLRVLYFPFYDLNYSQFIPSFQTHIYTVKIEFINIKNSSPRHFQYKLWLMSPKVCVVIISMIRK